VGKRSGCWAIQRFAGKTAMRRRMIPQAAVRRVRGKQDAEAAGDFCCAAEEN
jgi:hypothetical protein